MLILADQAALDLDPLWFEDPDGAAAIRVADEIIVDIMFNAGGESYNSLKEHEEIIYLEDIPIKTINLAGLLKTKLSSRDKDKMDRLILERAIEHSKRFKL